MSLNFSTIINVNMSARARVTALFRKNNLITQICGTKEFVLFAPDQTPWLYQYTDETGTHFRDRFSMIDLNSSVANAKMMYPLATKAEASTVVLHPGDVLCVTLCTFASLFDVAL
jgi:hypothetical protein